MSVKSFDLINPYGQRYDDFALKLRRPLGELQGTSSLRINKKIRRLIEYSKTISNKNRPFCYLVIYNLKRIANERPNAERRLHRRSHQLTDHGFCRILEVVCGLDMIALKDKALSDLENSAYEPIIVDNRIVSVELNGVEAT